MENVPEILVTDLVSIKREAIPNRFARMTLAHAADQFANVTSSLRRTWLKFLTNLN